MKSSELRAQLEELEKVHGDLDVEAGSAPKGPSLMFWAPDYVVNLDLWTYESKVYRKADPLVHWIEKPKDQQEEAELG